MSSKSTRRLGATLLATAFALVGPTFAPLAQAHACNGSGAIKIVESKDPRGKVEYWYYQNGKVCGRFVP